MRSSRMKAMLLGAAGAGVNIGLFGYVLRENEKQTAWLREQTKNLPAELPPRVEQPLQSEKSFSADFVSGGLSGVTTGAVVAMPEYTKVLFQSNPTLTWKEAVKPQFLRTEFPNMVKTIPSFSAVFGATCAIEFGVNARIGEYYGMPLGLAASAVSGATFLTAADHLLYRRHKGQSAGMVMDVLRKEPIKLFTGWTPMVAREGLFIGNVLALGPNVGKQLQAKFSRTDGSTDDEYFWNFAGRLTSGFATTIVSQPFDSLARQLQIQYFNQPAVPKTIPQLITMMKDQKLFYRGSSSRLFLATTGGALAGHFYDYYREKFKNWTPSLYGAKPADNKMAKQEIIEDRNARYKN